jgi:hypothetical protein
MLRIVFVLLAGFSGVCFGQPSNVATQRDAMKKLGFLVGKWSGNSSVVLGPGGAKRFLQTEDVQFKLDGLAMLVEGTGRNSDGLIVFRALATISYDDTTACYRFRAYNEGHYLDTELHVASDGFAWGYESGPAKVNNTMHLNEKDEWVETTETTLGSSPTSKSVEMTLRRERRN